MPMVRAPWYSWAPIEGPINAHPILLHLVVASSSIMSSLKTTALPDRRPMLSGMRHFLLYGAAMALLVFVLKWLQWKYLVHDHAIEVYIGLVAVLFTGLGGWVAVQLVGKQVRTVVVEKEVPVAAPLDAELGVNDVELAKLELTTREYEVLCLLSTGRSNAEIGERLFLSVSTVKTHVSNLLLKLDVKNRTQAAEKANRLRLTPRANSAFGTEMH